MKTQPSRPQHPAPPHRPPDTPAGDDADVSDARALRAEVTTLRRQVDNLNAALQTRSDIARALGILEERYDLDADAAFTLLARISNDRDTKLAVVATEFLTTRELPETQAPRAALMRLPIPRDPADRAAVHPLRETQPEAPDPAEPHANTPASGTLDL